MNADGSEQKRLVNVNGFFPDWSPDGKKIAFNYFGDIYTINSDGSGMTNLTNSPVVDEHPAWSPDGTKIAFRSHGNDNNVDIYVMEAVGSNPARLTTDTANDDAPDWNAVNTAPTDTTPPRVTSTVPSANATRVAPTLNVKATFSEDMMASTINKTTFTLRKQNATGFVAATVSYDPSTDTATLDPTNPLQRGDTYKASVNLGAQDQAGNPLDQNGSLSGSQRKDWTFKVRP
jgi:dipeptidyl aminopeptidase/acylaminoacyl peptidase